MEQKQTAVEYLVEQLLPKALSSEQYYHIEQAKEMEKQQHQATFNQGYDRRTYLYDLEYGGAEYWNEEPKKFEQYYNEEYGK